MTIHKKMLKAENQVSYKKEKHKSFLYLHLRATHRRSCIKYAATLSS